MRIDVIESNADLQKVRNDWDRVYLSDPSAQYFLSWIWLSGYLSKRGRWFILALREDAPASPYVAFFPLRLVTDHDPKTGLFTDNVIMAGDHAADYTGFIAEPVYETQAILSFALFLKSQNWTNLRLDNFCGSTERRAALIRALADADLVPREITSRVQDTIDLAICPVVALPGSWETYLETRLSSQTRQKLRRLLRQVENDAAFRITTATSETIDRDLDVLFKLWRDRWRKLKGGHADQIAKVARDMLLDAFRQGDLFVPVLWHADRPLGALANLLDHQKKSVLFYITGRDEEWKTPSPGLVLHACAIRHAIAEGFRSYDFLRGNEAYKYRFGAESRSLHGAVVSTRSGRNLRETLNTRSVRHAYETAKDLYAKGDKGRAEAAFRQVAAACPQHVGARFGLAQLLFDRGRLAEAEAACHALLGEVPDPVPVLIRLGDAQLALKKFDDAARTFDVVLFRQPNSSQCHFKKAVALTASGRTADAIKAFEILEQLHSDDPSSAAFRGKARAALARLLPPGLPELELPAIHPSGFPLAPPSGSKRATTIKSLSLSTSIADALKGFRVPAGAEPKPELPSPAASQWRSTPARTKH